MDITRCHGISSSRIRFSTGLQLIAVLTSLALSTGGKKVEPSACCHVLLSSWSWFSTHQFVAKLIMFVCFTQRELSRRNSNINVSLKKGLLLDVSSLA